MNTANIKVAEVKAGGEKTLPPKLVVAQKKEQIEVRNWRKYAGVLRAHLEARKKTEYVLLEELKNANVNHPLATEAGFKAAFEKMLAEQYGADQIAFDRLEMERMKRATEEGGGAVG